jgi:hypothetical protein
MEKKNQQINNRLLHNFNILGFPDGHDIEKSVDLNSSDNKKS